MKVTKEALYSRFTGRPYDTQDVARTLMAPEQIFRTHGATLSFGDVTVDPANHRIYVKSPTPDLVRKAFDLVLAGRIDSMQHSSPLHRLTVFSGGEKSGLLELELLANGEPLTHADGVGAAIFEDEEKTKEAVKAWSRVAAEFSYRAYLKTVEISDGCSASQLCVEPLGVPYNLDLPALLANKGLKELGSVFTVNTTDARISVDNYWLTVYPRTTDAARKALDLLMGENASEPIVSYEIQTDTFLERVATRISNAYWRATYFRNNFKITAPPTLGALFGGTLAYAVGTPVVPVALGFAIIFSGAAAGWYGAPALDKFAGRKRAEREAEQARRHASAEENLARFAGSHLKTPAKCFIVTSNACARKLPTASN